MEYQIKDEIFFLALNFIFRTMVEEQKNKKTNYFDFSEVLGYFFRKRDPNRPKNFNIKAMHTINKIAILMFLIAVAVMIVRAIMRA